MPLPSDAMSPDRDPRLYVDDMLEFCNTALGYTASISLAFRLTACATTRRCATSS